MVQKISLKEAERRAFAVNFQDGLLDIFIGCVVLEFAVAPLLSRYLGDFLSVAVFLPFFGLLFLAIRWLRRHVIIPRVGRVEYGAWRKVRLMRFNLLMLVLLVLALFLGALSTVDFGLVTGWMVAARFSLVVLVLFGISSYFLNVPRLYVYGVLAALSPMAGEWLYVNLKVPHHGFPVTFGLTSGIMIATGVGLFVRLLRQHPVPAENNAASEMAAE